MIKVAENRIVVEANSGKYFDELTSGIPNMKEPEGMAICVVDKDKNFLGGFLLHNYTGHNVMISVFAKSTRWIYSCKKAIAVVKHIAFNVLNCVRISGKISANNKHAIDFALTCGMKIEGYMPLNWDGTQDSVFLGFLK